MSRRMPLGCPRKARGELKEGEGYPTGPDESKLTSELPNPRTMDMEKLMKIMEEMANQPKEELGKRQPGERCAYERRYTPYEIQRSMK